MSEREPQPLTAQPQADGARRECGSAAPSRSESAEPDPCEGLPPDLAALLRDQSVLVPQDAAVFELIAKWMNAPSGTASA